MRTSAAIASHAAVGALQAGAMIPTVSGALPWWAGLLIQIGLIFGQGVLASMNSNTDQNGTPIAPVPLPIPPSPTIPRT